MALYRGLRLFLHTSAAGVLAYGFFSLDQLGMDRYISQQYGGHAQYLTIQGLCIAWLTMILGSIVDLLPPSLLSPFHRMKRISLLVALPLSVVISSIYWSLRFLFPAQILPAQEKMAATFDEAFVRSEDDANSEHGLFYIPVPVDIALHAAPAVALLLDFLLIERRYTKKEVNRLGTGAMVLYGVLYAGWVERCARFNHGIFPYPFLTENDFSVRLAIYVSASGFGFASLKALNALHPRVLE